MASLDIPTPSHPPHPTGSSVDGTATSSHVQDEENKKKPPVSQSALLLSPSPSPSSSSTTTTTKEFPTSSTSATTSPKKNSSMSPSTRTADQSSESHTPSPGLSSDPDVPEGKRSDSLPAPSIAPSREASQTPAHDATTIATSSNTVVPSLSSPPSYSSPSLSDSWPQPTSTSSSSSSSSSSSRKRTTTKPTPTREPPLFRHVDDSTQEACATFDVIHECIYTLKNLGATDADAFDCDCKPHLQSKNHDGQNEACGEYSDCINRATKVECLIGTTSCGDHCLNQRFQRKQYAPVSVIKTEKKGFGLRSNADLEANDFVFEYIGEVINEVAFRRRMVQYDQQGIKHFYFMSLNRNEFVDATRKGNLGRFCNHSCNPNCYVDKWVVGDKLRMGIFASRPIRAGEELVFNYNVDRYGADPQPCYCAEPNCTGFLGGKTQTERATKLSLAMVEALGIDDDDDDAAWQTTPSAPVKKARRKKTEEEEDEDYVAGREAKTLDADGARKVMAALMQCKEKWLAMKLLQRIQVCDDERVLSEVVRMHAYPIFKTVLTNFIDDDALTLLALRVLDRLPRITRNKISDSNIEKAIQPLTESTTEEIAREANKLLQQWSTLEYGYRIKRRKLDANSSSSSEKPTSSYDVDRNRAPAPVVVEKASIDMSQVPKGPKSIAASQFRRNLSKASPTTTTTYISTTTTTTTTNPSHTTTTTTTVKNERKRDAAGHTGGGGSKPHIKVSSPAALPEGWFVAKDSDSRSYYYDRYGTTTWTRPTTPAEPNSAAIALARERMLQRIIEDVTKPSPRSAASPSTTTATPENTANHPIVGSRSSSSGGSSSTIPIGTSTTSVSSSGPVKDDSGAALSPLQSLLTSGVSWDEFTPRSSSSTAAASKRSRSEKWKSLPLDKQKRLYEHTIFPTITRAADHYRNKIPKADLKGLVKDVAKAIVTSDYKHDRVQDPQAELSQKQVKKLKAYAHEFFQKAELKIQRKRQQKLAASANGASNQPADVTVPVADRVADPPGTDVSDDTTQEGIQSSNQTNHLPDQHHQSHELRGSLQISHSSDEPTTVAPRIVPAPPPPSVS